jgi:pimeloyl-ACP methyl ester carboxylesterase
MHHHALDMLPRLLDAFDIRAPVLFGHSDGGSIALIYAGSGARVRALVLEAPHVFVEPLTVASIAAIRDAYDASDLPARLARHHGDNADRLFDFWTRIWLSETFRSWTIASTLPAITCPTLVIQGKEDQYGTLRQVDAISGAVAGHVEALVLDGCGHSPHIDQRAAVEAAAATFIERWW